RVLSQKQPSLLFVQSMCEHSISFPTVHIQKVYKKDLEVLLISFRTTDLLHHQDPVQYIAFRLIFHLMLTSRYLRQDDFSLLTQSSLVLPLSTSGESFSRHVSSRSIWHHLLIHQWQALDPSQ